MRVAWVVELDDAALAAAVASLRVRLHGSGLVDLGHPRTADEVRDADVVAVWADRPLPADLVGALDELYAETENNSIIIGRAVWIAVNKLGGTPSDQVEKLKLQSRGLGY